MGHVLRLTSESTEAQSHWHWTRWNQPTPLRMCQNLWRCPQSAYSMHTETNTGKTEHMYVHSGSHKHTQSQPLTVSLSVSVSLSLSLPCVSCFALSRSLYEERPNFSLISFIKRCGEERRKRRRGEGKTGEKRRWGFRLESDE